VNENVSPAAISVKLGINLEIEYLRAIAVLLVVLAHADAMFPSSGLGQWTGLDLFFCISGYVISRAFEPFFDKHIAEGRWSAAARAFWVRRIIRLAPSAWLWLSVMVFCSWTFNRSGQFATLTESLKAAGYWAADTTPRPSPTSTRGSTRCSTRAT
jgi:peptidoglycan/LPS O-acetylase OafA/YrhL